MAKITIKNETQKVQNEIKKLIASKINEAGQKSVEFIKDRFRQGKDVNGQAFVQRKIKDEGRAVLVKNGHLMNSIRKTNFATGFILFAGDNSKINYAQIHNEGGAIKISARQRKFFWAMYYKKKNPFWKALALKKGAIKIPKREFFGLNQKDIAELAKLFEAISYKG